MKAIPKRTLLVTCIVILLPMFFGLALWNRLPERMPTHFDFSGTADDYSGRPFAVIGLPLFILAMQLFCAVMLRADPKKAEYLRKDGAARPVGRPRRQPVRRLVHVSERAGLRHQRLAFRHGFRRPALIAIGNYLPKCRHNYTVASASRGRLTTRITGITPTVSRAVWIIAGVVTLLSVFLSHAAVVWVAAIFVASSRRSSIRSFTRKGTEKSERALTK